MAKPYSTQYIYWMQYLRNTKRIFYNISVGGPISVRVSPIKGSAIYLPFYIGRAKVEID